jgi:hypothetical protein
MSDYAEFQRDLNNVLDARDEARRASGRDQRGNGGTKWPQLIHLVLAVGAILVTIVLAYATLDKRISMLEQKIDFIVLRVK